MESGWRERRRLYQRKRIRTYVHGVFDTEEMHAIRYFLAERKRCSSGDICKRGNILDGKV